MYLVTFVWGFYMDNLINDLQARFMQDFVDKELKKHGAMDEIKLAEEYDHLVQEKIATPMQEEALKFLKEKNSITSTTEIGNVQVSKTLNKVDEKGTFFFKKLLKLFTSFKDVKNAAEAAHYVDRSVDSTKKHIERGNEPYKADPEKAGELLSYPKKLLVEPQELKKTFDSHEAVAIAAEARNIDSETGAVKAPDVKTSVGEITAYRFEGNEVQGQTVITMHEGEITPTSHMKTKGKGHADEAHLYNVYVVKSGNKEYVIRTGKIDTMERAEEFMHLLREIHRESGGDKPLRVVSHQLNSFERGEHKLVNGQHNWLAYANRELKKKGVAEVMHINTPTNRWYHMTKTALAFAPAVLVNRLLPGEAKSRKQNIDSWPTYIKWIGQDFVSLENEFPPEAISLRDYFIRQASDMKKLDKLGPDGLENAHFKELSPKLFAYKEIGWINEKLADKKDQLKSGVLSKKEKAEIKQEIVQLKEELSANRAIVKQKLVEDYSRLRELEDMLLKTPQSRGEALTTALEQVSLMRQLLGSQLEIKDQGISRGKEGMIIQHLHDKLGVVAALNCKSGLDRTGLWHSIKLAMTDVGTKFNVFRMVDEWDKTTRVMNKLVARAGADRKSLAYILSEDTFPKDLNDYLKDEYPNGITFDQLKELK